ncbi:Uncharacterized conserved protein UCP006593 [Candidatus Magnetobacterium bavaricum]|uniref:Uncharacterized conserved protein UCP006593 n=1 Tax=Candidatus Magnetobacterium bavaricum TaxID=29290 RepID=A0A0F3H047_9BACT|nr:Uncharacterized conserved protein UCP006593 [Candidatus Magnetobacterium bavaricum]
MKTQIECFPCFVRQAVLTLGNVNMAEANKLDVIRAVLQEMEGADVSQPPAYATTFIYRMIRELTGEDPYKELKARYNSMALELYPNLKKQVFEHHDPLWMATRLSIAGNIIDFGIFTSVDIEGTIQRALEREIEVDDYEVFKQALTNSNSGQGADLLYLLDNAGEIVFDKLLIEVLIGMGKDVTAVVKGFPVINDVTIQDARDVGLDAICRVIDNGSDAVGTITTLCSSDFMNQFDTQSFIISKGQGNYETLCGRDKDIFFLFQAKCDVVARHLGLKVGAMLLKRNKHETGVNA